MMISLSGIDGKVRVTRFSIPEDVALALATRGCLLVHIGDGFAQAVEVTGLRLKREPLTPQRDRLHHTEQMSTS